jgi:O-methyltransferase
LLEPSHHVPRLPEYSFKGHHIISDQISRHGLAVVWRELAQTLAHDVAGDVVEFGCYAGTTSLFIRRLLDETGQSASRDFHVYDSFEGLPPKVAQDASAAGEGFQAGVLQVSKKEFLHQFRSANLQPPTVHKGWFNELTEKDVPAKIAFAFLDGDFYESIRDSLALVWPRLSPGGVILIDDYAREALPGATQAVTEFLQGKPRVALHHEQNIAIIRP